MASENLTPMRPKANPRELLILLAPYGSHGFRHILSTSLRVHPAKASTSTYPLTARTSSTSLHAASLPRANTALSRDFGSHVGLNTVRCGLHRCRRCILEHHVGIFRTLKQGQKSSPIGWAEVNRRHKKGKNSPFIPFKPFYINFLRFRCLETRKNF